MTTGTSDSADDPGRAKRGGTATARRLRARVARLARRRRVVIGGLLLAVIAIPAVVAPTAFDLNPVRQHLVLVARPPGTAGHLLGTDQLGRDMLARVLFGARVSLLIGISAVTLAGTLGVVGGLCAGYFGGRADAVLMRLADAQLAIPDVLFVIALVGISGPSLVVLIMVLGFLGWIVYARTVRAMVLSVREQTFVEAARAFGCSDIRILIAHVFPNVWTPVLVVASQQVGRMILLESTLSFLGIGVPPPTPSWGVMIAGGRNYLVEGWWITGMPGIALLLTVMAVNFLGDGLQDMARVHVGT